MDRRILLAGAGALVLAGLLAFFLWPKGEGAEPTNRRDNILKRAQAYGDQQEYQRALDLLDQLLIENAEDAQARELSDALLQAKKAWEEGRRQEELQALQSGQDKISSSLQNLSSNLRSQNQTNPVAQPAQPDPRAAAREAQEEEARRREAQAKAEAERLAAEKALAEKLNAAERAKRQLLNDGIALMGENRFSDARNKFSELLKQDDRYAEAHARMGESYFLQDGKSPENRRLAIESLNKAVAQDPNAWRSYQLLGDIYQEARNWNEAVANYKNADRLNPQNALVLYEMGKVYYANRQYREAASTFAQVVKLLPSDHRPAFNQGRALQQLKDEAGAVAAFQTAIRVNPGYAPAHFSLAQSLIRQGREAQAVAALEAAIKADSAQSSYHQLLGSTLFTLGKYPEAEASFLRALTLDDKRADLYNNLSVTQIRLKKLTDALSSSQKAVSLEPGNSPYWYQMGLVTEEVGDAATAQAAYQKALSLDEKNVPARINLAALYRKADRIDEALEILKRAYELDGTNLTVNNNLGDLYLQKKLYQEAIEFFRKALERKSDTPQIRFNLAIAYIETNQKPLAKTVLSDLIKLTPTYWDAYYRLGTVQIDMGEVEEGKAVLRVLLEKKPDYARAAEVRGLIGG